MASKRVCITKGCDKSIHANDRCWVHYSRLKRHGDDKTLKITKRGEGARFFDDVVAEFDGDECLIWPYGKSAQGYGTLNRDGHALGVHRLACERRHGPAPAGRVEAAHICGVRLCCNPRHLRWATPRENAADRNNHGTDFRGSKHPQARLTEDDVKLIREISGSLTQEKIAERFGIARSMVSHILLRRRWQSL